jgi:mono/diheme cytochrome c family protein
MKRALRAAGIAAGVLVLLMLLVTAYVLAVWDRPDPRSAPTLTAPHDSASVARGKYLFTVTWQCYGCHQSGPADPSAPPSGGKAFDLRSIGPGFGTYYSRNLTPDTATGIGLWTDGEFVQAIREGVGRKRHALFPIMPMDWLKNLSDEDALAIVAYLRSLSPVRSPIPANEPSFVAKALFAFNVLKPGPPIDRPVVAPPRGVTVEYGRYMATAAAGCGECHTPRNLQNGEFYLDSLFAGSSFAFGLVEGDPLYTFARNITPDPDDGIGRWTEEEFLDAVTAGFRPDSTALGPYMPYAHYKFLVADDLRAIFLYLKSLPPVRRRTPPPAYAEEVHTATGAARGKLLFAARCQACHGEQGMGELVTSGRLAAVVPFYTDQDFRNFVEEGQVPLKMPGFRKTLSRADLDDIIAYVRTWKTPERP